MIDCTFQKCFMYLSYNIRLLFIIYINISYNELNITLKNHIMVIYIYIANNNGNNISQNVVLKIEKYF